MPYKLIEINKIDSYSTKNEIVFDISVENDFSFCVENNIIVHNSACTTSNSTGFLYTAPMTLIDCEDILDLSVPLIADGGVKHPGDIAKAIALGAGFVMCGQLFSGYAQSAGNIIEENGQKFKAYFGNASKDNKIDKSHIEGKSFHVPYKGDMSVLLKDLKESLQSSISYCGGYCLSDLRKYKGFSYV